MHTKRIACLSVVVAALLGSELAYSHHGAAAYTKDIITLKAKITAFRFVNPHVQVYFDVTTEAGNVEHWQGELTAPNKLARAGWSKNTLKPDEECEISGRAGRDGAHSVWITKLVKADGQQLPLFESFD